MCVCGERERERRAGSACGAQLASFIWSAGAMSTEKSERVACCRREGASEGGRKGGGEVLKWMNESRRRGEEGALQSRLPADREQEVSLALCSRHASVELRLFLEHPCPEHFIISSPRTNSIALIS